MRLEVITLLALSTFELALACCGSKGVTTCCGKGKCNIFCCNCNGGCDKSCQVMKLPLCWAWASGYICDNPDGSTSFSGVGSTRPEDHPIPPKGDDPRMVALEGGAMGDKPDEVVTTNESKGANTKIIRRIDPMSEVNEDDAAMHRAVDGHGKGFFTLNEFLRYHGTPKTPELVDYFNKYDVNGDGVITPDEMRLPD